MITVNIQGHGTYVIPADKVDELIGWLSRNSTPMEGNMNDPEGTLLNG